jgi:FixJ family two-component response regulator
MTLTRQESRVLDLWDAGLSMQQIAAQTGIKKGQVERVVTYFDGRSDRRIQEASVRAGSAALLAAIRQVQP